MSGKTHPLRRACQEAALGRAPKVDPFFTERSPSQSRPSAEANMLRRHKAYLENELARIREATEIDRLEARITMLENAEKRAARNRPKRPSVTYHSMLIEKLESIKGDLQRKIMFNAPASGVATARFTKHAFQHDGEPYNPESGEKIAPLFRLEDWIENNIPTAE